jgi:hypothetical protein
MFSPFHFQTLVTIFPGIQALKLLTVLVWYDRTPSPTFMDSTILLRKTTKTAIEIIKNNVTNCNNLWLLYSFINCSSLKIPEWSNKFKFWIRILSLHFLKHYFEPAPTSERMIRIGRLVPFCLFDPAHSRSFENFVHRELWSINLKVFYFFEHSLTKSTILVFSLLFNETKHCFLHITIYWYLNLCN